MERRQFLSGIAALAAPSIAAAPTLDMISLLQRNPGIVVKELDHFGSFPWIRLNHAAGPTANLGVRRAIMGALDGKEIIMAALGDEPGGSGC